MFEQINRIQIQITHRPVHQCVVRNITQQYDILLLTLIQNRWMLILHMNLK